VNWRCLEILLASLAIQTFAKEEKNIRILVRTDKVDINKSIHKPSRGDSLMAK